MSDIFHCYSKFKEVEKNTGKRGKGDNNTKGIKARKNGVRDEDTKEIIPR
jgi:hypothetical protein